MAEFVEKRIQDMIPTFEKLQKLKIFKEDEIRVMVKKLRDYEYKLERHTLEDYRRYIEWQIALHTISKERTKEYGIKQKKAADIMLFVENKITNLYMALICTFQNDISIPIECLKFWKDYEVRKDLSPIVTKILQVHQDKDQCWHIAGQWELEKNKNKQTARQIFLRGLQLHPKSESLYVDIFKLELEDAETNYKNVDEKSKDDNTTQTNIDDDMSIELQKAYIIYEEATEQIKDIKFMVKLLNITKEYKNTEKLQNKIVSNLIQEYKHEPFMWDTMARQELEGLTQRSPNNVAMEVDEPEQITLKDRLISCNNVYKTAVKEINTKKMWLLYIEWLIEINENSKSLSNFKRKLLMKALSRAHKARKLTGNYYLYWIDMLSAMKKDEADEEKLKEILTEATETMPEDEKLWSARLRYLFASGKKKEAKAIFSKATQILGEKALPLWELKISNVQNKSPDKIEKVFQAALQAHPNVSQEIRPSYIEWLVINKDIQAARKVYDDISLHLPFSLELHEKMLEMELAQPQISLQHARKCHELATYQFGEDDINVWMEYIKFERKHGDDVFKPSKLGMRAQQTLREELLQPFIDEFMTMQYSQIET